MDKSPVTIPSNNLQKELQDIRAKAAAKQQQAVETTNKNTWRP